MSEAISPPEEELSIGTAISNRYVLEKCLGCGGMGSVYLASDSVLGDSKIAIKILHKDIVTDEQQTKRFLREVELMRRVNHVNVVRTYDVGQDGPYLYFTMEFVKGRSLRDIMDDEEVSFDRLSDLIIQVSEGLRVIHEADIIHRDLKPDNIMVLEDNLIKIADFGVARPKDSKLTQHDEIIGSVSYIAPEVWLGKPLTHSVDIYALGVILFEQICKQLPFDEEEPAAMMRAHVKQIPTPPKTINTETPNWLNQLVLKLLAKSPGDRPRNAQEIIQYVGTHRRQGRGVDISGVGPAVSPESSEVRTVSNATGTYRRMNATAVHARRSRWPGKGTIGFLSTVFVTLIAVGVFVATQYLSALLLL